MKPLARSLRRESTRGEVILWNQLLKDRKFGGYQFNRQYPIGPYIADFVCRKLRLIVEVDGNSHQYKTEEDAVRDVHLEKLGYRVLRVREWEG